MLQIGEFGKFSGFHKCNTLKSLAKLQFSPSGERPVTEVVGAVRFELTTSCTRNKRASQATLRPDAAKKLPVVEADCNDDFGVWHLARALLENGRGIAS